MNNREAAAVMQMVHASWPGHRWTEEAEDLWLRDLVSIEAEVGVAAVQDCRTRLDYAPSWHQYLEAVRNVRRARASSSHTAIGSGPSTTIEGRSKLARTVRGLKTRTGSLAAHNHKARVVNVYDASGQPVVDEDGAPVVETLVGRAACPVCLKHDHSDRTIYGFTITKSAFDTSEGKKIIEHKEPVPAWYFTCPRCGVFEQAQEFCSTWTPAGIAHSRAQRATVASPAMEVSSDF